MRTTIDSVFESIVDRVRTAYFRIAILWSSLIRFNVETWVCLIGTKAIVLGALWEKQTRMFSSRSDTGSGRGLRRRNARNMVLGPRGFTLIELLVVVSIIALLLAILIPSLSRARAEAKTVVCGTQLKMLGNGLATYSSEYSEWIPGMNTTGVAVRALRMKYGSEPDLLRDSSLPVQAQDWITPLFAAEEELPRSRAKRMRRITEEFKCPSQIATEATLYQDPGNPAPDMEDFATEESWTELSYLMPVHFQYWGEQQRNKYLAPFYGIPSSGSSPRGVKAKLAPDSWEVSVPSYVSRVGRVGPPARKIAASDGTRYLDQDLTLDFDVSPAPNYFGSFSTSGAWWAGSVAYGVAEGSANWNGDTVGTGSISDGQNLRLSYRHGKMKERNNGECRNNKGKINSLFFDGHVSRLSDEESRAIEFWYPKGGVVQSADEGMTEVPDGFVIP